MPIRAQLDASLDARIITRRPLLYTQPTADSGPHVRASSGLCWLWERLAIVQDDALFLALVDPAGDSVTALPLPVRDDGARLFDVERGNKKHKLDLEACVSFTLNGAPALLGLGSGSHPNRETLLLLRLGKDGPVTTLLPAPLLYAALRTQQGLLSTELNLEGCILLGDEQGTLRLFQRSNGTLLEGQSAALCATCDISFPALLAHLLRDEPLPPLQSVVHYELGSLGNARLTFTDAALLPDQRVLFLASAEGSPNAYDDGEVQGSSVGLIDKSGVRMCLLRNELGEPVRDKAEGILPSKHSPSRAYVVFDPDDHRVPATLAEVELSGF